MHRLLGSSVHTTSWHPEFCPSSRLNSQHETTSYSHRQVKGTEHKSYVAVVHTINRPLFCKCILDKNWNVCKAWRRKGATATTFCCISFWHFLLVYFFTLLVFLSPLYMCFAALATSTAGLIGSFYVENLFCINAEATFEFLVNKRSHTGRCLDLEKK